MPLKKESNNKGKFLFKSLVILLLTAQLFILFRIGVKFVDLEISVENPFLNMEFNCRPTKDMFNDEIYECKGEIRNALDFARRDRAEWERQQENKRWELERKLKESVQKLKNPSRK